MTFSRRCGRRAQQHRIVPVFVFEVCENRVLVLCFVNAVRATGTRYTTSHSSSTPCHAIWLCENPNFEQKAYLVLHYLGEKIMKICSGPAYIKHRPRYVTIGGKTNSLKVETFVIIIIISVVFTLPPSAYNPFTPLSLLPLFPPPIHYNTRRRWPVVVPAASSCG